MKWTTWVLTVIWVTIIATERNAKAQCNSTNPAGFSGCTVENDPSGSVDNTGVLGVAGKSGSYAVAGIGTVGTGVHGEADNTSVATNGVEGFCKNGAAGVYGQNDDAGGYGVAGRVSSAGTGVAVYGDNDTGSDANWNGMGTWAGWFHGNVNVSGSLTVSSCTGCGTSSDSRLKKNVKPITGAIEQLLQLKGITYEWIEPEKHGNATGTQHGFIAQEVEKVFPNWVHEGSDGFKVLDYRQTEALEVESIRILKAENDALKNRVASLESKPTVASTGFGPTGLLGLGGFAALGAAMFVTTRRKRGDDRA